MQVEIQVLCNRINLSIKKRQRENSAYREESLIHLKSELLLLKSIQLFELTLVIMAIALVMGNGGKFANIVWADEITGTDGDDTLVGTVSTDTINGLDGDDKIDSKNGKDQVNGNRGNDELHGGKSRDVLKGGPGNDKLFGEGSNDKLYGGTGNDDLKGGSGADFFDCGKGERFWTSVHSKVNQIQKL